MIILGEDIYGIIYKITNIINEKVYIGQTTSKKGFNGRYCFSGEGIERVYKYHLKNRDSNRTYNKHLLCSIKQYGFDNFTVTEVFDIAFSKEGLNEKEQNCIKEFDSFNNGYNNTLGGEGISGLTGEKCYWYGKSFSKIHRMKIKEYRTGKKLSLETRTKISLANKGLKSGCKHPLYGKTGHKSPNFGKHRSELAKQKISVANKGRVKTDEWCKEHSESMKGKNNPMWGISPKQRMSEEAYATWLINRKVTDEAKAKMSKAKKNKPLSEEHKRSLSASKKNKREIINLDTMEKISSIKEAANRYNVQVTGISGVCRGIRKTCGGYGWMYYDEYKNQALTI